jgi:hypothetical protein
VRATIRLAGAPPRQVRPLDLYGVPRDASIDVGADGSFVIDGTARTYYYEILR